MSVSVLLSGLIGALIASLLAVLYQYVSLVSSRRFDAMLLAVEYFDEINYLTRQIEACKAKKYLEKRDVITPDEYRSHCNRLDALITSSKIHARVALVYGDNSATLDKFNELRGKMTDATLRLFKATEADWSAASAEIHKAFEKDIDPLRHATELKLLRSAGFKAVLLDTLGLGSARRSSKP